MTSIAAAQSQPTIPPKTIYLRSVRVGACVRTAGEDPNLIAILLSRSPGSCHVRVVGRTGKVSGDTFPYESHWASETEVVAAESPRTAEGQTDSSAPFGSGPRLNGVLVHYSDYPHIPSIRSTWTPERIYPYANKRKALGMKGSYDPSDCKVVDWGKHQKPAGA